ncbi:hypothetical protein [Thalassotalea atypica]|uniref:hypothetical protein n=1 Tax=Thalassotalea atypica TaxID=2054316 RepID=UPI0025741ADE|nr:hypothetical protein [Thalassotalea atypica]
MRKLTLFCVFAFLVIVILSRQFIQSEKIAVNTGLNENNSNQASLRQEKPLTATEEQLEATLFNRTIDTTLTDQLAEIITCPTPGFDSQEMTLDQQERLLSEDEQQHDVIIQALKHSNIDHEQLAGILFDIGISTKEKLNELNEFHQKYPSNKIAYLKLLSACHSSNNNNICNQQLFDKANAVDQENGMIWLSIAAHKFTHNDLQGAFESLTVAAKKSFFSEYFYESIALFDQTVSPMTSKSYAGNIASAIGHISAHSVNYGQAFEYCLETEVQNIEVLDACFQLGENMEHNSHSLFLSSLGSSLVKEYYLKLQDDDAAAASEQRSSSQYQESFNEQTSKATLLMYHDEDLMRLWLQLGLEHGEFSALKQLTEEAKWRSQDPNYNPCKAQVVQ